MTAVRLAINPEMEKMFLHFKKKKYHSLEPAEILKVVFALAYEQLLEEEQQKVLKYFQEMPITEVLSEEEDKKLDAAFKDIEKGNLIAFDPDDYV